MNAERNDTLTARAAATQALCLHHQHVMRHYFHRQVLSTIASERALLLAAHPDDIVVGCGGTLMKMIENGTEIKLCYFTDGRAVVSEAAAQAAMAVTRADEARELAVKLGVDPPKLFACNENEFTEAQHRDELTRKLVEVLNVSKPDTVFLPYLFDMHKDHRYTNVLLADALKETKQTPKIFGYEVWSFAPPGVVVDITEVMAKKRELIGVYESQVQIFDYVAYAEELNRSHAGWAGPDATHCEVFCPFTTAAHEQAIRQLALDSPAGLATEVLLTPLDQTTA